MKAKRYALLTFIALAGLVYSCSTDSENTSDPMEDLEDTDPGDSENPDDGSDAVTQETIEFDASFTLDKERMLTSLVLPEAEYNKFLEGDGDIAMVSNKVYEYFQDDFDFIFILSVEEEQPSGLYYGRSSSAKNDVQGLGGGIWDNTAAYGSQGNLKSIIHMPRTEYVLNGPFLHEIAHYWANHGLIATTVGGHWGYASTGGQLGGFDMLEDLGNSTYRGSLEGQNGFGTFANGGNSVPYSVLELYAMGLVGEDELETVLVAQNPQSTQEFGVFTADAILSLTPADLIAQNGERIPSVENSQKTFKGLAVVISTSPLDQEKIDSVTLDLQNFSRPGEPDSYWGNTYNFWKATGGRGELSVEVLDANLK